MARRRCCNNEYVTEGDPVDGLELLFALFHIYIAQIDNSIDLIEGLERDIRQRSLTILRRSAQLKQSQLTNLVALDALLLFN